GGDRFQSNRGRIEKRIALWEHEPIANWPQKASNREVGACLLAKWPPQSASFCRNSRGRTHLSSGSNESASVIRESAYPATNGSAGGKLPAGKRANRSPDRSFAEASRKTATNQAE